MFEFVGLLKSKTSDREGDSQNGHWRIAQFLLETVEMYPKKMVVDVRDGAFRRIEEFESLIGKNVRVEFDVDANEYNERWYNRVTAFRIYDRAEEQAKAAANAEAERKEKEKEQDPFAGLQNGVDGLPY